MTSDHQLSERVYHELKTDLLDGKIDRHRFGIPSLEVRYHASATPIREALLRLVGEGLIDFRVSGGFEPLRLSEKHVRDLYELNMRLMLAATAWHQAKSSPVHIDEATEGREIDGLFLSIAAQTSNLALVALVESMNHRMRRIRRVEIAELSRL
jgi:DNA-binding GntR family transcriptional regulator